MRFLGFLFLAFLFLSVSPIKKKRKEFNLTVKVTGIQGTKGMIEVGLFDEPSKYASVGGTCRKIRKKTSGSGVSCTFYNLPEKKYGVCIYHDENSNDKCDKNFFGIPTEGYGFSNNTKPILVKPLRMQPLTDKIATSIKMLPKTHNINSSTLEIKSPKNLYKKNF